LRFFSDKALKEAGVKSAIMRAMMLRRIREHHKKRKREEADEDEVVCTVMLTRLGWTGRHLREVEVWLDVFSYDCDGVARSMLHAPEKP
jgi:hypothetical protein